MEELDEVILDDVYEYIVSSAIAKLQLDYRSIGLSYERLSNLICKMLVEIGSGESDQEVASHGNFELMLLGKQFIEDDILNIAKELRRLCSLEIELINQIPIQQDQGKSACDIIQNASELLCKENQNDLL